jgi:hypothetical protein
MHPTQYPNSGGFERGARFAGFEAGNITNNNNAVRL